MKICYITDLHIDVEGIMPNDIDSRGRFLSVLDHIRNRSYDLMVLGGDLCNKTGNIAIYQWIKEHLDATKIPYHVISGNHDTSPLLAQVFELNDMLQNDELFYHQTHHNHSDIIYLDTAVGKLSDEQHTWLETKIQNHPSEDVIICMHHPPIISGSAHMEPKYFFRDSERFTALLQSFQHLRFIIFCGHYHIARTVIDKNIIVFITPSTFVQIDPDSAIFQKDGERYGYREIMIQDGKVIRTNVIYVGL
jgi:3',5'-cyclic-AMP phosphodiesterase